MDNVTHKTLPPLRHARSHPDRAAPPQALDAAGRLVAELERCAQSVPPSRGDTAFEAAEEAMRARIGAALGLDLPELRQTANDMALTMRRNWAGQKAAAFLPKDIFDLYHRPDHAEPAVPKDPRFWFYEWNATTARGITFDETANGQRYSGRFTYEGDAPLRLQFGMSSLYGLDAPRRQKSTTGAYVSAPIIEMTGNISGFQGLYHWLWAADNKRCAGGLTLTQTLYELEEGTGAVRGLGKSWVQRTLFNMKNVYGIEVQHADFYGDTVMPAVRFIPTAGRTTFAHLDIRFDFLLEGDAAISFGQSQTQEDALVIALRQWAPTTEG